MTGFCFQYEWLRTGSKRALLIGSAALGLNLLTRLTTGLDLITAAAFLVLALWFEGTEKPGTSSNERVGTGAPTRPVERRSTTLSRGRLISYLKIAFPIYCFFLFLDRLYQFYRFGNWTTTYVHYFTIEHRLQDPTLPAKYPWETPFHVGFLGALISPEKSIFLFDPLIVLTIVLVLLAWKRFDPQVKAYVVTALLLVLGYICLYARYTVWNGNFAWGDRYVSTATEMAAFISVPLLLKFGGGLGRVVRVFAMVLIAVSLLIQLASLAFWLPLEIYQIEDLGSQFVIWLRFKNILAFAFGKMDAWGLNTDAMGYDQWDYQHITTWNFLPFVLRRVGAAPRWVVDMAFGIWGAGIAVLVYSILKVVEIYLRVVEFYHEPQYQE
jgi:hypothetical protein